MNGKGLLTNEENQTYFLKDIMEAVKSEELDDDFCLYAKGKWRTEFSGQLLAC